MNQSMSGSDNRASITMKTLSVELNDQAYQQVIHFLHTLPKQAYHLLDEYDQQPESMVKSHCLDECKTAPILPLQAPWLQALQRFFGI